MPSSPPSTTSSSSSPSALTAGASTDVSLTIDGLIPSDFGEYQIDVYFARGNDFAAPKRVFPVVLEEAHGPASLAIIGKLHYGRK